MLDCGSQATRIRPVQRRDAVTIVERYSLTIDGVAVETEEGLEVCNPAIGKSFARAPKAGKHELDAAVAAAQVALPGWRARTWADRAEVIGKMADVIEAHADELASLFVTEQAGPFPWPRPKSWVRPSG